jgi:hypothetical protein
MISRLASAPPIRRAAAREGLGTMVYEDSSGDGKESVSRLDGLFEKFAAESKHPGLRGAPVIDVIEKVMKKPICSDGDSRNRTGGNESCCFHLL